MKETEDAVVGIVQDAGPDGIIVRDLVAALPSYSQVRVLLGLAGAMLDGRVVYLGEWVTEELVLNARVKAR